MTTKRYLKITMLVLLSWVNFSLLSSDPSKNLGAKSLGLKDLYQNLLQKAQAQRTELLETGRNTWPEGPDFYDALLADTNKGIAELKQKLSNQEIGA